MRQSCFIPSHITRENVFQFIFHFGLNSCLEKSAYGQIYWTWTQEDPNHKQLLMFLKNCIILSCVLHIFLFLFFHKSKSFSFMVYEISGESTSHKSEVIGSLCSQWKRLTLNFKAPQRPWWILQGLTRKFPFLAQNVTLLLLK